MPLSWVELELESRNRGLEDVQNRMTMVLLAIARRSHKISMHYGSCDVHPKEVPPSRNEYESDVPVRYGEPGRCSCGWEEEANELNRLLNIAEGE